ncbi:MAG TPA: 50S ribosomal protein L3 [Candidatus Cloacimonadota bacterium]|nr:50S ribosomal protein L3 [Candidatus Cloacimonadota bacterium]HOV17260.1 50S ribosomal protein L3 [Candidatus Cloacimonadota bacterium]HQL14640.1 50S ribosomal protein L3 [Candidatus Cloacimonadota bacterium]
MLGLIGKKIGMTQIFDADGKVIPVTVISAGPCRVICKRTKEENGYEAVQVGYEEKKEKHTTKPLQGHFKKHNSPYYRFVREFRLTQDQSLEQYQEGDVFTADMFNPNDLVTIVGTSKGRGFSGVVKRHGFAGFEQSHGVHESFRGPGSVGQCAQPSKIFKGVKMAGHYGNARVTLHKVHIVKIDKENNLIMVKGPIPGHRNGLVVIKKES